MNYAFNKVGCEEENHIYFGFNFQRDTSINLAHSFSYICTHTRTQIVLSISRDLLFRLFKYYVEQK